MALEDRLGAQPKLLVYSLPCLCQPNPVENRVEKAKSLVAKYEDNSAAWLGIANVYKVEGNKEEQQKALAFLRQDAR